MNSPVISDKTSPDNIPGGYLGLDIALPEILLVVFIILGILALILFVIAKILYKDVDKTEPTKTESNYCKYCGKEIKKDYVFCKYCGTQINNQENQTSNEEI